MNISKDNPVFAWWSGGVTSAIACKIAIDFFGRDNVRLLFIDTFNEDDDTYRFKRDCEKWYGKEIETCYRAEYSNIKEVWFKYLSLNVAHGAICSSELKRDLRKKYLPKITIRIMFLTLILMSQKEQRRWLKIIQKQVLYFYC